MMVLISNSRRADTPASGRALRLIGKELQHALLQTALRFAAQKIVQRHAVGRGKIRQVRLAQFQREVAALGDLHAVLQRLRQIGEQLRHLGLRLEILLRGELLHAALVVQHIAFGDAHARLMRLEIVDGQELHRMRRHHRQASSAASFTVSRRCTSSRGAP